MKARPFRDSNKFQLLAKMFAEARSAKHGLALPPILAIIFFTRLSAISSKGYNWVNGSFCF